jgi:hypothetical protein
VALAAVRSPRAHAAYGEAGFRPAHGCGFWDYLDRHPETAALVDGSMARIAEARAAVFARAYDWAKAARVVDVGGGHGAMVQHLLQAQPHLRGVVFERPSIVDATRARLAGAGLAERSEVVAGDFFEGVPEGGDVYVLSWILHDFGDADAARILARCRGAMGADARLLVVELVLPPAEGPHPPSAVEALARTVDLEMLAVVGGRERTEAEFAALLAGAGLSLARVLPLPGMPWSVIEARVTT